jgi:hypothetical protein
VRGSVGEGRTLWRRPRGSKREGKKAGEESLWQVRVVLFPVSPFLLHVLGFRWAFFFLKAQKAQLVIGYYIGRGWGGGHRVQGVPTQWVGRSPGHTAAGASRAGRGGASRRR